MNNGCRQGRHAHAHSGARVVGRDIGCGWVGLGSELDLFPFFKFSQNESYISLIYFFFFLFYLQNFVSISIDNFSFARIFCTFF